MVFCRNGNDRGRKKECTECDVNLRRIRADLWECFSVWKILQKPLLKNLGNSPAPGVNLQLAVNVFEMGIHRVVAQE